MDGRLDATVTVRGRGDGEHVVLEVQDNGPGIPKDLQNRIFDPFFTTKGEKGSGLGLSIVHGIVSDHNGVIELESQDGVGSLFSIRLPRASSASVVVARSAPAPADADRPAVVCVDDHAPSLRVYRSALGRKYALQLAATGSRALELLRQLETVDAVVCDLRMPGIQGKELFERACAERPELRDRFVFVTGLEPVAPEACWARATGQPVLFKSFSLSELREVVASVVYGTEPLQQSATVLPLCAVGGVK